MQSESKKNYDIGVNKASFLIITVQAMTGQGPICCVLRLSEDTDCLFGTDDGGFSVRAD